MKKIFTLLTLALLAAGSLAAQDNQRSVHGYVIDKNGNPIAGAEVMATGGGETAITDSDGSFRLTVSPFLKTLTATYTGMGSKKLKTKFDQDMIFRMSPKISYWFLNAVGCVSFGQDCTGGGGGLMAGYLGNWGGYLKGTYDNYSCLNVTAGVTKSFSKTVFGYLGVGYGDIAEKYWNYSSGIEYTDYYSGMAVEIGCIFKTSRHFNFTVGYTLTTELESYPYTRHNINVGIGYVF